MKSLNKFFIFILLVFFFSFDVGAAVKNEIVIGGKLVKYNKKFIWVGSKDHSYRLPRRLLPSLEGYKVGVAKVRVPASMTVLVKYNRDKFLKKKSSKKSR